MMSTCTCTCTCPHDIRSDHRFCEVPTARRNGARRIQELDSGPIRRDPSHAVMEKVGMQRMQDTDKMQSRSAVKPSGEESSHGGRSRSRAVPWPNLRANVVQAACQSPSRT